MTARARLAFLNDAPSRFVERKTPRIKPIDWFFMSAERSAPVKSAPFRLAREKSAATRAPLKLAPSILASRNCVENMLAPLEVALVKSELSAQA